MAAAVVASMAAAWAWLSLSAAVSSPLRRSSSTSRSSDAMCLLQVLMISFLSFTSVWSSSIFTDCSMLFFTMLSRPFS